MANGCVAQKKAARSWAALGWMHPSEAMFGRRTLKIVVGSGETAATALEGLNSDFDQTENAVLHLKTHFDAIFDQIRSHANSIIPGLFECFGHFFDRRITFQTRGKLKHWSHVEIELHQILGHVRAIDRFL